MATIVIDGMNGLRALADRSLGTSEPVRLTQESINQFCHAVGNDGWMHLDVKRAKASHFGNTIAPSMLTLAYFSTVFQQMVEVVNVPNMMLLGADRIRLLRPLVCERVLPLVSSSSVSNRSITVSRCFSIRLGKWSASRHRWWWRNL